MYGSGGLVFRDIGGSTPAGTYESASQVVRVDPAAPRYTLSFWRYNRYYGTLRGRTKATLTFRLYQTQPANFRSETAFDDVQTSGFTVRDNGFERQGTWTTESTYGNLIPSVDIFDPNLPTHVFQAVSDEFARKP